MAHDILIREPWAVCRGLTFQKESRRKPLTMSRWAWVLQQLGRRLWVRATLIGALGVVAAVLAAVVERYMPQRLPFTIGAEAIDSLLSIIASSMLAVTTFSLSVMTSAFGSATSNVTPRATQLLIRDRLTQNVLSSFVGSFIFSIVGLIVLKLGAYGERGRAVLFVMTIAMIVLIVVSLLRWIDYLLGLGRVGETTQRVENATRQAMQQRLDQPFLGGHPWRDAQGAPRTDALAVPAGCVGYVQHIDVHALSELAASMQARIYVDAVPGRFVYVDSALAWLVRGAPAQDAPADPDAHGDAQLQSAVRDAFTLANERDYDQDPRFGLAVLAEIASRALSPAVNDAGTALDVIGRLTRLLTLWGTGERAAHASSVRYPQVFVRMLEDSDLFEDAFMPIARDGAGHIEVQLRLRKALTALQRLGRPSFRAAAHAQARLATQRAEHGLPIDADRQRLQDDLAPR